MRRSLVCFGVLLVASALPACDDGNGIHYPDVDPPDGGDGDIDDGDVSETGCRFDSQCEDGVDCTRDECDRSTGLCSHVPDHESCQDGLRCNGFESCDARLGCQPGIPNQDCNDGNPCTIDICIEPASPELLPSCEYLPMDRDGDGHVDLRCPVDPIGDPTGPRGDDCDDLDPTRHPGAGELCFDGVDNDCDGLVDDLDDDCLLWNDECSGALELVAGRFREGFSLGARGAIDISCGWSSYPDVAYFFDLEAASDVTVEVWGRDYYYPMVAVQTECGARASEIRCVSGGTSARFFQRAMAAGRYYVVVESWSEGIFDLLLTVEPVSEPPVGDDCTSPIVLAEGVPATIDLGLFEGGVPVSCGTSASFTDGVFAFVLPETSDVRYEVSGRGVTPYVGARTVCEDVGTELSCAVGNPQIRTLCALDAGAHFLIVRGGSAGTVTVEVSYLEPSEPPVNDRCDGAVDVSAGGRFPGSLICSEGDYDVSCDYWAQHEVLYTFSLDEPRDVELRVVAEDGLVPSMTLSTLCGDRAGEILCLRDRAPRRLVRSLEPGTYFVVVAGEFQAPFELEVTFSAPTSACDGALALTESTVVSDDTRGRGNDFLSTCGGRAEGPDIAYLLEVAEDFDLHAEVTAGAFDTVLHLRTACDDPATEIACDDDGGAGSLSRIVRSGLAAGSYVLVMDGFWSGAEGPFTLEVDITPR